jgi:hypothetical protein
VVINSSFNSEGCLVFLNKLSLLLGEDSVASNQENRAVTFSPIFPEFFFGHPMIFITCQL